MSNLYYEFTGETQQFGALTLHRIRATRDLPHFSVRAGDEGGWLESKNNLAGNAWVSNNAWVYDRAVVSGRAHVSGEARVYSKAWIYGNARIRGEACVYGEAQVYGDAVISGSTHVHGGAVISGDAMLRSSADFFGATTYTSFPIEVSLARQKDGGHIIGMGCWEGSIDDLEGLFMGDPWVETSGEEADKARPEMLALCAMLRARIARWEAGDA